MAVGERRRAVLRMIVEDYISRAVPVASSAIVERYRLKVSPATIRNDMAYLEREGYVVHPHRSAGSVPTDKAYRYYVELIGEEVELPSVEEHLIRQISQEAKEELEQWLRTMAVLLARLVCNLAVITTPKASRSRLKHVDLVALQDFMALLVVVLYEAKIRRQLLSFARKVTQDELTTLANKLTFLYAGMTGSEILADQSELPPEEKSIVECVAKIVAAEDQAEYGEPYLEGLRLLLGQPEFRNNPRVLNILEVLEGEDWLRNMVYPELGNEEIKVIIGEENPEPALQDLSLIASQYGVPGKARGIVGVIGPKRMDYAMAISSLNCLSTLLSNSVAEYI
ncbi:MAG: heat-inducible transcriptional repressor HrcA [Dehalococcoidia bacterium]